MNPTISAPETPDLAERATLGELLNALNEERAGPSNRRNVALLLKEGERTVGGLWGRIYFERLFIELLFIPENLRGRDIGSDLLKRAEAVAVENGCALVLLDTYDFQAPKFYEKQGYSVTGVSQGRTTRYSLEKRVA